MIVSPLCRLSPSGAASRSAERDADIAKGGMFLDALERFYRRQAAAYEAPPSSQQIGRVPDEFDYRVDLYVKSIEFVADLFSVAGIYFVSGKFRACLDEWSTDIQYHPIDITAKDIAGVEHLKALDYNVIRPLRHASFTELEFDSPPSGVFHGTIGEEYVISVAEDVAKK